MSRDGQDQLSGGLSVHVLRATLLDVSPSVWRELRVPSSVTLNALHLILQVAFGWENRHLHEWRVGDAVFATDEDGDLGDDIQSEAGAVLGNLVGVDDTLSYDYDLGDGWEHLVEVVSVEPWDATVPPVAVLAGARSAPPEDSGGPAGYEHLLDALRDPDDEEHDEVVQALGDWFDPDAFDLAAVNRRLEPLWRR